MSLLYGLQQKQHIDAYWPQHFVVGPRRPIVRESIEQRPAVDALVAFSATARCRDTNAV
jgi:hypothetical protein